MDSCEACFLNVACPVHLARQKRVACPRCGSINLKKHGEYHRRTDKNFPSRDLIVPILRCEDCGRKFVKRKNLRHRVPAEVIDFALALAQRQISLRIMSERINEKFGIEISHMAIGRWVRTLSDIKLPKGRPHNAEWRQKISRALKKSGEV